VERDDPWLGGRDDDFFGGDDAWEDVEPEGHTQGDVPAPRRGSRTVGEELERLRADGRPRVRRLWLAIAGGVAVLGVVLGVVLAGRGGSGTGGSTLPLSEARPTTATPAVPQRTSPATTTTAVTAPIVVPVPGGTTLSQGDSGPAVRALQRALKRVGHDPGAADGAFGPGTAKAVAAFQRDRGLAADGIVGPATARALTRAQRG
jgi:hypothetical protein